MEHLYVEGINVFIKKVQVVNDQEKAQSEGISTPKTEVGKLN